MRDGECILPTTQTTIDLVLRRKPPLMTKESHMEIEKEIYVKKKKSYKPNTEFSNILGSMQSKYGVRRKHMC